MPDFYQTGIITTLHYLGTGDVTKLERELVEDSEVDPIALVIPSLASEMEGPALAGIVQELAKVPYLNQVVIALDRATEQEFLRAREFFKSLPQPLRLVWIDGPRIQALYRKLDAQNISAGPPGKGRGVWTGIGYVLADQTCRTIAIHDADIVTYNRGMLARLCYPVVNPALSYEYAKGFYARVTDRMHGRVTRLFFTPLIRTLLKFVGYHPYLVYLDSFRYPLAGEFVLDVELARAVRIPSDWGLEIGFLGEVYRNVAVRRICEVDIAQSYEHKHQPLDATDQTQGLMKMAIDIAKSLFRTLAQEGATICSEGFFRSLRAAYLRAAEDQIARYAHDAAINGLHFDRHSEALATEAFAKAIQLAAVEVLEDPLGTPLISNWARVDSAIPTFLDELLEAVESDNA
jgi:glucosyl-3-phosphoglycerate synthase